MTTARQPTIDLPIAPITTVSLIVLMTAVYLVQDSHPELLGWASNNADAILRQGQFYRLITSLFIHQDAYHIVSNMFGVLVLGVIVEASSGHRVTLLVYVLGGITGSVISLFVGPQFSFGYGASGAMMALGGAELVYFLYLRRLKIRVSIFYLVPVVIFLGLAYLASRAPGWTDLAGRRYIIGNWAHLGGLIGGIIVALITTRFFSVAPATVEEKPDQPVKNRLTYRHWRVFRILFIVSLLLIGISLLLGVPALSPQIVTIENISMTLPVGWLLTDMSAIQARCEIYNISCLMRGWEIDGVAFELDRDLSGLGRSTTLNGLDRMYDINTRSGLHAVDQSREEITVAGQPAIRRVYTYPETGYMMWMINLKDQTTLVTLYISAPANVFDERNSELTAIVDSLRLDGPD